MLSQTETTQIVSPIQRLLSPLIRWTTTSSNKSLVEPSASQQLPQSSQFNHRQPSSSDLDKVGVKASDPLLIVNSNGEATIQVPDGCNASASDVQSSHPLEKKVKKSVIPQENPYQQPLDPIQTASCQDHVVNGSNLPVKRILPRRAFNRDILESDLIFGASSNNPVVHGKERLLPAQKVVISDLSHYRDDKYEAFDATAFEDPNESQHFKTELKVPTFTHLPALEARPHLLHRPDPLQDEKYLLAHQTMEQYSTRVRNLERNKVSSERIKLERDLEVLEGSDWRQAVIPTAAKRGNYVEEEILVMRNRRIDELKSLLDRMTKYYKDNQTLKERMDRELVQWNQQSAGKNAIQRQEQRKRKFPSKSNVARNSKHSDSTSSLGFIQSVSQHKAKSKEFSLAKMQSVSRRYI